MFLLIVTSHPKFRSGRVSTSRFWQNLAFDKKAYGCQTLEAEV